MKKQRTLLSKSFQKSDFEHKITLIPLYQNEGYSLRKNDQTEQKRGKKGQKYCICSVRQIEIGRFTSTWQ